MSGAGHHTPFARYQALLDEGVLQKDDGQSQIMAALDHLYLDVLSHQGASPSLWQKLTNASKSPAPKGLYIYGGVGRGKSRLMDMFYDCLPRGMGLRVHFHDFMVMAHDAMNAARKNSADDPIMTGAQALLSSNNTTGQTPSVLCFDEMEVRDIADAMIVKRLFDALFDQNITIVATSNRHPDSLYKGGLHRDRFLPFIAKIKAQCDIIEIADGNDWRARLLGTNPRWYSPANDETDRKIRDLFEMVTADKGAATDYECVIVKVAGRDIAFDTVAHNIAFVSFEQLCAVPLAARDYVAIADRLTGLFITDIPQLGNDEQNEARRFMWLIDALYDRGRFVVASAQADMASLYSGDAWAFEFDRTLSRLQEMTRQSYEGDEGH